MKKQESIVMRRLGTSPNIQVKVMEKSKTEIHIVEDGEKTYQKVRKLSEVSNFNFKDMVNFVSKFTKKNSITTSEQIIQQLPKQIMRSIDSLQQNLKDIKSKSESSALTPQMHYKKENPQTENKDDHPIIEINEKEQPETTNPEKKQVKTPQIKKIEENQKKEQTNRFTDTKEESNITQTSNKREEFPKIEEIKITKSNSSNGEDRTLELERRLLEKEELIKKLQLENEMREKENQKVISQMESVVNRLFLQQEKQFNYYSQNFALFGEFEKIFSQNSKK